MPIKKKMTKRITKKAAPAKLVKKKLTKRVAKK